MNRFLMLGELLHHFQVKILDEDWEDVIIYDRFFLHFDHLNVYLWKEVQAYNCLQMLLNHLLEYKNDIEHENERVGQEYDVTIVVER